MVNGSRGKYAFSGKKIGNNNLSLTLLCMFSSTGEISRRERKKSGRTRRKSEGRGITKYLRRGGRSYISGSLGFEGTHVFLKL